MLERAYRFKSGLAHAVANIKLQSILMDVGLAHATRKDKAMKYDEALQLWGASKLVTYSRSALEEVSLPSVSVKFDFNEGYACCGGRDPNCYCSFYESPSSDVLVEGRTLSGEVLTYRMDAEDFDFALVLAEIVAFGRGEGITE